MTTKFMEWVYNTHLFIKLWEIQKCVLFHVFWLSREPFTIFGAKLFAEQLLGEVGLLLSSSWTNWQFSYLIPLVLETGFLLLLIAFFCIFNGWDSNSILLPLNSIICLLEKMVFNVFSFPSLIYLFLKTYDLLFLPAECFSYSLL